MKYASRSFVRVLLDRVSDVPADALASAARVLLAKTGHRTQLPLILSQLHAARYRLGAIDITTAHALSLAEREAFQVPIGREFPDRSVFFHTDPKIIDGFRITIGDTVIDASTKSALTKLRKALGGS